MDTTRFNLAMVMSGYVKTSGTAVLDMVTLLGTYLSARLTSDQVELQFRWWYSPDGVTVWEDVTSDKFT